MRKYISFFASYSRHELVMVLNHLEKRRSFELLSSIVDGIYYFIISHELLIVRKEIGSEEKSQ